MYGVHLLTFSIFSTRTILFGTIQLWTFAYVWLLNKPYENEVTLKKQKIPLKCCQPLDFLYTL